MARQPHRDCGCSHVGCLVALPYSQIRASFCGKKAAFSSEESSQDDGGSELHLLILANESEKESLPLECELQVGAIVGCTLDGKEAKSKPGNGKVALSLTSLPTYEVDPALNEVVSATLKLLSSTMIRTLPKCSATKVNGSGNQSCGGRPTMANQTRRLARRNE
ncbi:hypothetical protein Tco_1072995, partial [Tanacetum coccineum]